jgi:uncharacterized phage protein (TIGR02216 family)
MSLGLGVLRLAPRDFWSMTPRELALSAEGLFGRPAGPPSPSLDDLRRLAADFPDA